MRLSRINIKKYYGGSITVQAEDSASGEGPDRIQARHPECAAQEQNNSPPDPQPINRHLIDMGKGLWI